MRYGIGILFILFLLIVGTVLLIGGGNSDSSAVKASRLTKIADYTKDGTTVSLTTQGRVVGDDQRRAIRVSVSSSKRTVEILDGYEERVSRSQEFANSPAAFEAFARSLDNAGFGKERTVKQVDERGVCPLGKKYIYRLTDRSKEVMRTWSDSCLKTDGTFGGGATAPLIQQLFKAQITDYGKFTSGVQL